VQVIAAEEVEDTEVFKPSKLFLFMLYLQLQSAVDTVLNNLLF
jgi:hypothetical protein